MNYQLTTVAWGGLLRLVEAFVDAAPTILCGLLVVGVLQRLLGHTSTRRLLGSGHWRALPQAWALGMLLPVCSLGVIPVCRELRRAGVSGGVILAFALSAPLFNPLSMMYGLTLSKPIAIFAFAACSFVVLTFVGGLWDRLFPGSESRVAELAAVPPGFRRMLAVGVAVCREAASVSAIYLLAGLLGVALLGVVLPFGSLQTALNADDPNAPLVMLAVGLLAYATPMTAMMQIGSMFHHGNSIGAAFVLLTVGAGTNLGLLAWAIRAYGLKRATAWLALIATIVLGIAYVIDRPLRDVSSINVPHVKDHPHTHAFDIYCQPFPPSTTVDFATISQRFADDTLPHEMACVGLIAALLLVGMGLRIFDPQSTIESWLERQPLESAPAARSIWNRPLSGTALGGTALVGIVALSIVGCYIYYPDPASTLEELRIARTEVYSAAVSGDHEAAEDSIEWAADLTRRLEVGVYLRRFYLSEECRQQTKLVRDLLEELDHAIEDKADRKTRIALGLAIDRACVDCRPLYLPGAKHIASPARATE